MTCQETMLMKSVKTSEWITVRWFPSLLEVDNKEEDSLETEARDKGMEEDANGKLMEDQCTMTVKQEWNL